MPKAASARQKRRQIRTGRSLNALHLQFPDRFAAAAPASGDAFVRPSVRPSFISQAARARELPLMRL